MTYRNHRITVRTRNGRRRNLGDIYAKIHGPLIVGTATPNQGGRFAAMLYACRIVKERTQTLKEKTQQRTAQ